MIEGVVVCDLDKGFSGGSDVVCWKDETALVWSAGWSKGDVPREEEGAFGAVMLEVGLLASEPGPFTVFPVGASCFVLGKREEVCHEKVGGFT